MGLTASNVISCNATGSDISTPIFGLKLLKVFCNVELLCKDWQVKPDGYEFPGLTDDGTVGTGNTTTTGGLQKCIGESGNTFHMLPFRFR